MLNQYFLKNRSKFILFNIVIPDIYKNWLQNFIYEKAY
jgi:hypothetical protein